MIGTGESNNAKRLSGSMYIIGCGQTNGKSKFSKELLKYEHV
jgi:hypothetical protein